MMLTVVMQLVNSVQAGSTEGRDLSGKLRNIHQAL
jgi:hypothetical protein